MKKLILLLLPALAGCLGSAPPPAVNWIIRTDELPSVASVAVNAPYDDPRITVLRPDGSVAFDAYNVFAARPLVFLRQTVVKSDTAPGLVVRTLALDCREAGRCEALAEVTLHRNGSAAKGTGRSAAAKGDYSAAFTEALKKALADAAERLGK